MSLFFIHSFQGSDRAHWANKSCEVIIKGEAFENCRNQDTDNRHQSYYQNCVEQACR